MNALHNADAMRRELAALKQVLDHRAPSRSGCGTTGCEAHDGECRDAWGDGTQYSQYDPFVSAP